MNGDGFGQAQIYSAATDRFGPVTRLSEPGGVFNISSDGQVMAYGLEVLDQNLQLVRSVRSLFGSGVAPSFLAADGQDLYYVMTGRLVRTRVSDGAVVEGSRLPIFITDIGVSDDGAWAVYHGFRGGSTGEVGAIDLR